MCAPAAIPIISTIAKVVAGTAAVAGTVKSIADGNKAKRASKNAAEASREQNNRLLRQQEAETSRNSARAPNISAILASNRASANNPTLLTGAGGVSSGSLSLGTNSLLGE